MEKVLALDLSTKRSGWAYYEAPDCKISYGVIASSSADVEKRISVMRDGIIELLNKFEQTQIENEHELNNTVNSKYPYYKNKEPRSVNGSGLKMKKAV